ncbi:MAG: hypothetical protein BJ554DRAFT_5754 [Olpidium bornovanus]|uniref:Uncharacterized protein n=1 Tax=Olpidium bornovanus TaxID=278681 RepID=A0A8H7ZZQ9_9FUNG|nr:MAG: hypothetical protein BJ554DRAFT_5754 [Olpidium bornovanus]
MRVAGDPARRAVRRGRRRGLVAGRPPLHPADRRGSVCRSGASRPGPTPGAQGPRQRERRRPPGLDVGKGRGQEAGRRPSVQAPVVGPRGSTAGASAQAPGLPGGGRLTN